MTSSSYIFPILLMKLLFWVSTLTGCIFASLCCSQRTYGWYMVAGVRKSARISIPEPRSNTHRLCFVCPPCTGYLKNPTRCQRSRLLKGKCTVRALRNTIFFENMLSNLMNISIYDSERQDKKVISTTSINTTRYKFYIYK